MFLMRKGILKRVIFVIFFELQGKKIGVGICEDICYSKEYNLVKNYSDKHLKKLKAQTRFYFKIPKEK